MRVASEPNLDAHDLWSRPRPSADERAREAAPPAAGPRPEHELNEKEQAQVARLKARDIEVRNHEAAHAAAAGAFGGGASYTYVTGPDGHRYAVGGEVPVRMVGGRTPEEAIRNAAQVRAAALAPAEPSSQDRAVAAEAAAMETEARAELAARRSAEAEALRAKSAEAAKTTAQPGSADRADAGGEISDAGGNAAPVAPEADAEATLQKLEQERLNSRGSWRHLHSSSGCGSCAVAVASYS